MLPDSDVMIAGQMPSSAHGDPAYMVSELAGQVHGPNTSSSAIIN